MDENKRKKKINLNVLKRKFNNENENSFQSFSKYKRKNSLSSMNNEKLKEDKSVSYNNSYFLNPADIQEIHINFKNMPKVQNSKYIFDKNNKNEYSSQRKNSLSFRNVMKNSYSNKSINSRNLYRTKTNISDSSQLFQNNANTQQTLETYDTNFEKNKKFSKDKNRKKENYSVDISYYRPDSNINKYETNTNSFMRKYESNEYYSHNNSFNINSEDNKLNNTVNYNQELKNKSSLISMNAIPKPKYKKKIPAIPIRRVSESNNNSFYFDDINSNNNIKSNNINIYNQNNRYYDIKTINYTDLYKYKRKIFTKNNIKDYKNKIYANRTYSPKYLQNIKKTGLKISFNAKKKNDSIDLISPELFNDLKVYSCEKPRKQIIFSDLDINKANEVTNMEKNMKLKQKKENYNKMRKKYIKRLSNYLLKNKNKLKKKNENKKGKYDIIDIKEKIKEDKRIRSISNTNKFKKKDIIKDSPFATEIKKEDDKGGKIDFQVPNINVKNDAYNDNIKDRIKAKIIYNNKINYIDGININKRIIHMNAAKKIQKWWRTILISFFKELSIIKIQSVYRAFIFRKTFENNFKNKDKNRNIINDKFQEKENILKIKLIQKKWKEFYIYLKNKKTFNSTSSMKEEEKLIYKKITRYQYDNNFYGNMSLNNIHIQKNYSFGITPDKKRKSCIEEHGKNYFNELIKTRNNNNDFSILSQYKNDSFEIKNKTDDNYDDGDINNYFKSIEKDDDIINTIKINAKNNLKICFYTKEYYKNIGIKQIIYIQNKYRNHLNKIKNGSIDSNLKDKPEEIKQLPLVFPSNIVKIRLIKTNLKKNDNNEDLFENENRKNIENIGSSLGQTIINYMHNFEFEFNINEIKPIPFSQKCYFTKKNILIIKKKPIKYEISKINLEEYSIIKNDNAKIYCKSFKDHKNEFQISKNINNFIKSSYSNDKKNYYINNNKYLISNFSNEINGEPKKEPIYEISSINTNIISSKDNNKMKNKINKLLEIDNKNKTLNYISSKLETIIKKPIQIRCYLSKYIIKDKNIYKAINTKLKNNSLLLDENIEENKDSQIYQIPKINNNCCYISKKNKKDNFKEIIALQKFLKKNYISRRNLFEKTYMKIIVLNSHITKEYKDNSLDKQKIILIQKLFREFRNYKKNRVKLRISGNHKRISNKSINSRNNNQSSLNSFKKNTQTYENIDTNYGTNDNISKARPSFKINEKNDNINESQNIINSYNNNEKYKDNSNGIDLNRIRTAYQINIFKNKKDDKNLNDFLRMLIQRINKNINQYSYEKIKKFQNNFKKQKMFYNINDYEDNDNISLLRYSKFKAIKESFFFKTLKRHLKINKEDNNWEENNEVINLLKNNISKYFNNYPKKNFIPYINEEEEDDLVNNQLFLFNDEKLADYIYKCYKIENNSITITPYIIKNRLIKDPLKNQNIFTITRYMDNLYNDINSGKICKNCCCKSSELCLAGCKCHNQNYINNIINGDNINKNLNINDNIINNTSDSKNKNNINSKKIKNKNNLKFEILKRFSESNEDSKSINSNNNINISNEINYNINAYNTVRKNSNNNENLDKSLYSNNTEYNKNGKINNLIRNFSFRKKMRKSISSNKSNENEEMEIINYDYNLNNNLKEKTNPEKNLDYDQCNIYDDDVNNSEDEQKEEIKIINNPLSKKKFPFIPFPTESNKTNKKNMVLKKVNSFRYQQDQYRRKYREIIKLRDTNIQYDNEIYENT